MTETTSRKPRDHWKRLYLHVCNELDQRAALAGKLDAELDEKHHRIRLLEGCVAALAVSLVASLAVNVVLVLR